MKAKQLIHKVLLLTVVSAGAALLWGEPHPPLPFKSDWNFQAANPNPMLEQAERAAILREMQPIEALGRLDPVATPVTIPFAYTGKHIVVPTRMQGWETAQPFILDSGARTPLLDEKIASNSAFSAAFRVGNEAVYGRLDQVSLESAHFRNIGAFAVEFSAPDHPLYCLSKNGVVGASMMRHGIWQIDYQKQTLTVANRVEGLEHVEDAIAIPFEPVQFSPAITLTIGSQRTVKVLIDTGWGGSIHLAAQDVPWLHSEGFPEILHRDGLAETLRGLATVHQTVVQVPTLSIGSLSLEPFPVLVSEGPNAPPYSLMGNDFLEHFIVTLDWSTQRLYLKPVPPLSDLYPATPDYGFQAIVQNHQLLITGLYRPSPVDRAGLQIGDQILAINGDNYTHLSDEQFCDFVLHPVGARYSGPITMTVQRQGKLLIYHIQPATP